MKHPLTRLFPVPGLAGLAGLVCLGLMITPVAGQSGAVLAAVSLRPVSCTPIPSASFAMDRSGAKRCEAIIAAKMMQATTAGGSNKNTDVRNCPSNNSSTLVSTAVWISARPVGSAAASTCRVSTLSVLLFAV